MKHKFFPKEQELVLEVNERDVAGYLFPEYFGTVDKSSAENIWAECIRGTRSPIIAIRSGEDRRSGKILINGQRLFAPQPTYVSLPDDIKSKVDEYYAFDLTDITESELERFKSLESELSAYFH